MQHKTELHAWQYAIHFFLIQCHINSWRSSDSFSYCSESPRSFHPVATKQAAPVKEIDLIRINYQGRSFATFFIRKIYQYMLICVCCCCLQAKVRTLNNLCNTLNDSVKRSLSSSIPWCYSISIANTLNLKRSYLGENNSSFRTFIDCFLHFTSIIWLQKSTSSSVAKNTQIETFWKISLISKIYSNKSSGPVSITALRGGFEDIQE